MSISSKKRGRAIRTSNSTNLKREVMLGRRVRSCLWDNNNEERVLQKTGSLKPKATKRSTISRFELLVPPDLPQRESTSQKTTLATSQLKTQEANIMVITPSKTR